MKVICISGKAQNGKDTTAKILEEQLTADGFGQVRLQDLLRLGWQEG